MNSKPEKRIERFTHPITKVSHKDRSYVFDSSKDPSYGFEGAFEVLQKVSGGNLTYYFEEAEKELKNIEGTDDNSAWEDMISYIEEFRAKEINNRINLTEKYYGTEMWEHINLRFESIDENTTAVLRAAIRLYTTNSVYAYLNNSFRSGESFKIRGFSTLLRNSFKVAPYFVGAKVYRGTNIEDYDSYENGLIYRWPFFVSASASKEQAEKFGHILCVVDVPKQFCIADISNYSIYPEESEVLFHPYTRFEVIEKRNDRIDVTICAKGIPSDMV